MITTIPTHMVRLFPVTSPTPPTSQLVKTGQPDTDSHHDVYGQRLGPSAESLNGGGSSAPNLGDFATSQYNTGLEPYPAWGAERNIPLSKKKIEGIFLDLQQKFGFQRDSMRNMVRFEYCVPHHPVLVIHGHRSSTSRCTFLIAVRRACLPTRHSSPFMRTTSGGSMQITASGTLLPSSILTMLLVILKTQVFSASALSVAEVAIIPRNLSLTP